MHHSGLDQRPWAMADRSNGFVKFEKITDKGHSRTAEAQGIWTVHAPGQQQPVMGVQRERRAGGEKVGEGRVGGIPRDGKRSGHAPF